MDGLVSLFLSLSLAFTHTQTHMNNTEYTLLHSPTYRPYTFPLQLNLPLYGRGTRETRDDSSPPRLCIECQ